MSERLRKYVVKVEIRWLSITKYLNKRNISLFQTPRKVVRVLNLIVI
jgi:hypothetical protein